MIKLLLCLTCLSSLFSLSFSEAQEKAHTLNSILYPYHELGEAPLLIFAHGSLIDPASASRTFSPETMKTRSPALAFGLKRVFDRDVPIEKAPHWGVPKIPSARGMLNVHPTYAAEDLLNGVLMTVQPSDFDAMRAREIGYDLIPVVVVLWDDYLKKSEPNYLVAYALHAKPPFTNSQVLPRPGYYEMARDAAKKFGPTFYALWVKSTYLADRRTPISEWEACVSGSN